MRHFAQMVVFAALLATFFAFLAGRRTQRLKFGMILFGTLAGGGLLLSLIMYPFN